MQQKTGGKHCGGKFDLGNCIELYIAACLGIIPVFSKEPFHSFESGALPLAPKPRQTIFEKHNPENVVRQLESIALAAYDPYKTSV